MGRISGLLIGVLTLIFSLIITLIMWQFGIPLFFFVFFLPLIGFSFGGFGKEEDKKEIFFRQHFKYCPRCGYKLEGWEKYCPMCGYELREF